MSQTTIILGFQPGGRAGNQGRGRSGVALMLGDGAVESDVVRGVDEAFAWFRARIPDGAAPVGAGIAAPLFWETSAGGARRADTWLRRARPEFARAIRPLNAVMGATVMQGMAMALRLRAAWPAIGLNETRPGPLMATFRADPGFVGSALAVSVAQWSALNEGAEDRSAALLSAWWTARCLDGPAPHDLALLAPKALMPAGQATSFWPLEPARWLAA
ncbi:hypothetical protein [Elioraea sp.]|uniref:hypothetical protein n=1 Tax=Elioraea sp. TaxID=2185103 RepID=UPI0025BA2081|nr:hypothetical protein [Elioraea sp.]